MQRECFGNPLRDNAVWEHLVIAGGIERCPRLYPFHAVYNDMPYIHTACRYPRKLMRKLSIRKPTAARLRMFLEEQASLDLTYREVGATMTASNLPIGYVVDRTQVELGSGAARFEAAKEAMRRWEPFQLGWVEAWPVETPLEEGQVVAIMGWAVGLWWLNSTRIVYVIDESGDMERFGFGYGTLPGHVERGEERFCIAWNRETDQVSYEIFAFSRPQHILARLGYPWVRRSQKRFARESAISMYRSVNGGDEVPLVSQSTD